MKWYWHHRIERAYPLVYMCLHVHKCAHTHMCMSMYLSVICLVVLLEVDYKRFQGRFLYFELYLKEWLEGS